MLGPFWCQSRQAWFLADQDQHGVSIFLNPIQNNQPSQWQRDTQSNHWLVDVDGINKLFYLNKGRMYALTLRKLDQCLMVQAFDDEQQPLEKVSPFFKAFAKEKDNLFQLNEGNVTLDALHQHFLDRLSKAQPTEIPECEPPLTPLQQQLEQRRLEQEALAAKQRLVKQQQNEKLAQEKQWQEWCELRVREQLALQLNGIFGEDTEKIYESFRVILDGVFNGDIFRTMDSYRQALEHVLTDFKNQNYIAINTICMQTRINNELKMSKHNSAAYIATQKRLYVFSLLKAELDQLLAYYGIPLKPFKTVLEKPDPSMSRNQSNVVNLGEEKKGSRSYPPIDEDPDLELAMRMSQEVPPSNQAVLIPPDAGLYFNLQQALELALAEEEEEELGLAIEASLALQPNSNNSNAPSLSHPISNSFQLKCYMALAAISTFALAIGLAVLLAIAGQVALAVAVPVGVVLVGAAVTYGIFKCKSAAPPSQELPQAAPPF